MDWRETEGKKKVEAFMVHVTISVVTILAAIRLDADKLLTAREEIEVRSKRELAT
jgi:hypothetical protein